MQAICVVTGGSSGIGLSCISSFIEAGYKVYNLDRQQGPQGEFIQCDISDKEAVDSAISHIIKHDKKIDVLFANAGIYFSGNLENTSEEAFDRVMNINVKGTYLVLKAILPHMRKQKSGNIVLMSSDQAFVAKANSFAYNTSKAAIAAMTKTTALDYAQYNIRCNAVCPGTIETELYHNAVQNYCDKTGSDINEIHKSEAEAQPIGHIGQPQDVANLVLFLASDKASFITGSLYPVDGGYIAR